MEEKWKRCWLWSWNFANIILPILILAGCRDPASSALSLSNPYKRMIEMFVGDDCASLANEIIPDEYRISLTSSCRVFGDEITCRSHSPPALDWVRLFEADIAASADNETIAICTAPFAAVDAQLPTTDALATTMFALLIICIFMSVAAIPTSIKSETAFGRYVTVVTGFDMVLLVVCMALYLAIAQFAIGPYIHSNIATVTGERVNDVAILGVGFWLLLAALVTRAVGNPVILWTVITLIAATFSCLLSICCCCGGGGGGGGGGEDDAARKKKKADKRRDEEAQRLRNEMQMNFNRNHVW